MQISLDKTDHHEDKLTVEAAMCAVAFAFIVYFLGVILLTTIQ